MAKGERMVSASRRTEWALLLLFVRSIVLPVPTSAIGFDGIPGDYCLLRKPVQCCNNRDDDCTMPILGNHLCYCDRFCKRDDGDDCCPDFRAVCEGIQPSPQMKGCQDELGTFYPAGGPYKVNCNSCWKATNYSAFWGQTLDDGVKYRLGTLYPERSVKNMNEILIEPALPLPEMFDARERWPGFIYPVRDQGNCGASWAFSTTAVSADRLAIQSGGKYHHVLSSQQLLSCNQARQRGCNGGYLDRAWWYIRKYGVVSEECYPYVSGRTNEPGECRIPRSTSPTEIKCPSGSEDRRVFKMTPPYRISTNENDIMTEIMSNGPVQTTFLVHEDFFMYKSGVYRHLRLAAEKGRQYEKSGYHSVRIIGWGVDHSTGTPVKYWLCANSWGEDWGENGLFRIVRGENHCDIETFVIGAWGKGSKKRRRKFKVVRKLRHLRRQHQQQM
ncbi:tubulointerstitial nephritis antigen [Trichuris trichiura]|uniref:Tubulointerstitial nephritis antigen n=1 Tax=Trichuris trichiura TaxID=36087 RepID=A0A077Z3H9_TRITR|nr:tubulointerstitial nephritis antigen [Trichuris trichiura]